MSSNAHDMATEDMAKEGSHQKFEANRKKHYNMKAAMQQHLVRSLTGLQPVLAMVA
jgi:hypothetical protein